MRPSTVTTDEFGVMTLDATGNFYEAEVDVSYIKSKKLSIAAEDFDRGVSQMSRFLAWLGVNHQSFKLPLGIQIQNYDLVWDDIWDSILGEDWVDAEGGFLADYLSYESVVFDRGKIYLWIDTSGLHTDHKVRVTMNESMQIERCEMM